MDQELISFLDQRFRETSRQIEGLREETMQRFEQVDRRFEQIDTRFEQVDRRFEQIDTRFEQIDRRFEQIDVRFEQVDRRFEQVDHRFEHVKESIRHTRIEIEGLRGDIQAVAEGVIGLDEKLVWLRAEVASSSRKCGSWYVHLSSIWTTGFSIWKPGRRTKAKIPLPSFAKNFASAPSRPDANRAGHFAAGRNLHQIFQKPFQSATGDG